MNEPTWTASQQQAIAHRTGGIVVSAAAGSGKTSVLAARCAALVCDGPSPCDLTELLVVTFTNLAADEMRHRIQQAIYARHQLDPTNAHIRKQLSQLDRARISTIDSFYLTLIRKHFNRLDVDVASTVLGEDHAKLMRRRVSLDVVQTRADEDRAVAELCRLYYASDDGELATAVSAIQSRIATLDRRDAWLRQARHQLDAAADPEKFLRTQGVRMVLDDARRVVNNIEQLVRQVESLRPQIDATHPYQKDIDTLISQWKSLADWARLPTDRLVNTTMPKIKFDRLSPASGKNKSTAAEQIRKLRDTIKKQVELFPAMRLTSAQLLDDGKRCRPFGHAMLDLVEEFDRKFIAEKRAIRALDFDDAARLCLQLLTTEEDDPSDVALELNREFKHVLVDESQDLSPIQDRILSLVSTDERSRTDRSVRSNLFSVGDVKQSIYRFRLAEPEVFLDRLHRAQSGQADSTPVYLRENFRTRPALIDALNRVFLRLFTEEISELKYDDTQRLVAGTDRLGTPPHAIPLLLVSRAASPDIGISPGKFQLQAVAMADQIRQMIDSGQTVFDKARKAHRPMRFGDIAILLRRVKHNAGQLSRVFRSEGIPVRASDKSGFYESMEVRDVLALLEVLDNRFRDQSLAALIRSPIAQIDRADDMLAAIRVAHPNQPFAQAAAMMPRGTGSPLATLLARLDAWRELARLGKLSDLLDAVYRQTGLLEFNRALPHGQQRVANLLELLDQARQFDASPGASLSGFIEHLHSLDDQDATRQPEVIDADDDQVQLLTMHASKGLEFPVVFVAELDAAVLTQRHASPPIAAHRNLYLGVDAISDNRGYRYATASSLAIHRDYERQAYADTVNLLYVAMTRAREQLFLVGSAQEHEKPVEPKFDAQTLREMRSPLGWLRAIAKIEPGSIQPTSVQVDEARAIGAKRDATDPAMSLRQKIARCESISSQRIPAATPFPGFAPASTFAGATHTFATIAASELAHPSHATPTGIAAVKLPLPRFMQDVTPSPSAREIGTAVHRFIELLDLSQPCDADDLLEQARQMLDRKLLSPLDYDCLDLHAVAWFFASEPGQLMRTHRQQVIRELAIDFSHKAIASDDPQDLVLARGRIDTLVKLPQGLVLIDYKTDRVLDDHVESQARRHAAQLRLYDRALTRATGLKVIRRIVAFLLSRRCVDV